MKRKKEKIYACRSAACIKEGATQCNLMFLAGMYASQVWGTEYVKEGKKFPSKLQVRHMSFLKGTLGVKHATPNWAQPGKRLF
eukprot:1141053-Pelagomonas_calceolata.AAC.1